MLYYDLLCHIFKKYIAEISQGEVLPDVEKVWLVIII
jgi:hypothetical protein